MDTEKTFWTPKKILGLVGAGIAAIFLIITLVKSITTVEKGNVGVVMNWGAVQPKPLEPGLHFITPYKQSVEEMSVQLKTYEVKASAASKDLQTVNTTISVQHSLNGVMAPQSLQAVGDLSRFDATVVSPAVMESLKATTARYTAEELITKRDVVKLAVTQAISDYLDHTLEDKGIRGALHISNVAITDFDFSKEFNEAIEAKVKAEQQALQAKNEKEKRITQSEAAAAEQRNAADAEAYAITQQSVARAASIKREAEALRDNPDLIRLRAIEKWNGTLPTYQGGQQPVPFINVSPPPGK